MAWHSAGTYRIADGRGGAGTGMQRFAPISQLVGQRQHRQVAPPPAADQAQIRQRPVLGRPHGPDRQLRPRDHGPADLRLRRRPARRLGGRQRHLLGPRGRGHDDGVRASTAWSTRDKRWRGKNGDADYDLENPLAASHQALIYVNPEGPYANGDPMGSARDIRITFTRMAMNDEETVALIAGGHAFGKSHGMVPADEIGPPPEMAPDGGDGPRLAQPEGHRLRQGHDDQRHRGQLDARTRRSGTTPTWKTSSSSTGSRPRARPARCSGRRRTRTRPRPPTPTSPGQMHPLMMMTSDIALKVDPEYRKVCEKFLGDFDAFTQAFSKAWYKLTHRDMGPKYRYLGPEATIEDGLLWQDPLPDARLRAGRRRRDRRAEAGDPATGLSVSDLAFTAFSAAVDLSRQRQARRRQRRPPRPRPAEGLGGQPPRRAGGRGPAQA